MPYEQLPEPSTPVFIPYNNGKVELAVRYKANDFNQQPEFQTMKEILSFIHTHNITISEELMKYKKLIESSN